MTSTARVTRFVPIYVFMFPYCVLNADMRTHRIPEKCPHSHPQMKMLYCAAKFTGSDSDFQLSGLVSGVPAHFTRFFRLLHSHRASCFCGSKWTKTSPANDDIAIAVSTRTNFTNRRTQSINEYTCFSSSPSHII